MRIGILGGTFDPIHFGHIRPALEIKSLLGLDSIWLMPNHIPPHKASPLVNTKQRLAMVELVCQEYKEFKLCDIEARRSGPSYLFTTLEELNKIYPEHEFFFLIGTDSLVSLPSWYHWQSLFNLCHFVVSTRKGWRLTSDMPIFKEYEQRLTTLGQFKSQKSGLIFQVDITPQAYSSTQIRQQVSQGLSPSDAVPRQVLKFIAEKNLYQTPA
ncbi:nicotinate-nucleotide adenylyltransferase [Shewanella psychrophila]|uniref:Probable nicotinate-nucleotide adenylyltransferase n=1 Tax=Shewanella psychrophila TaxID=225848 RepID=A0A1S6HVJ2_9GAMM|nr:nicotinate-nucleotide adenylyltransferase [Shewanella psychrophila]AQS39464.1 nicotinate-nucleotide adenylyltransferase [Shewanella psychrophila]